MKIGYSTGSLARSNFRLALDMLRHTGAPAVELSALREHELEELVNSLDQIDLSGFRYISFHAPSRFENTTEEEMLQLLLKVADRRWPVIVHPDVITTPSLWRKLGSFLCIENMDKRKPIGQTCSDLSRLFMEFPEAGFCLDLAHAKQVDPSMMEAGCMLKRFRNRLVQLHVSDVNSASGHEVLNTEAIESFRQVAHLVPENIPIILESPNPASVAAEIAMAARIFEVPQQEYRFNRELEFTA